LPIWVAVLTGGALGSLARHGVNILVASATGRAGPYATAIVNLAGSLTIGVLAGLIAAGRLPVGPSARAFVFVGILGGFTTFSSFMLDSVTLAQGGEPGLAAANVIGQTVIGFAVAWAGYHLGVAL
jgi:CrcB protein